jgi:hypothetical protein
VSDGHLQNNSICRPAFSGQINPEYSGNSCNLSLINFGQAIQLYQNRPSARPENISQLMPIGHAVGMKHGN